MSGVSTVPTGQFQALQRLRRPGTQGIVTANNTPTTGGATVLIPSQTTPPIQTLATDSISTDIANAPQPIFGNPNDQSQSTLCALPQELKNQIYEAFYQIRVQIVVKQLGHGVYNVRCVHVNSLALTCREIELHTRHMRQNTCWEVTIDCSFTNRMPLSTIIRHPVLQVVLSNIVKISVVGLRSGDINLRSALLGQWRSVALAVLPSLKDISLDFTDNVAAYSTSGMLRSYETVAYLHQMRQGALDYKYSWPAKRLGLDILAQELRIAQRNNVEVHLLSRKVTRRQRESEEQDTMIFRIFHDKIKTIAREGAHADADIAWSHVTAEACW